MKSGKKSDNLNFKEFKEICRPKNKEFYLNMRLGRKISIYLSWIFVHLGISATAITFSRFFIGLIGIFLIGIGEYKFALAGLLIFQFAILLDLSDGEVYRYQTWKTKKKQDILLGPFLDKVFDHFYRPLLLIAAGVGAWNLLGNIYFLYLGMAGAFLITTDQMIKLRIFEVLVYRQRFEYLREEKARIVSQSSQKDKIYELFRINNLLTLYFWFGVFGYLHIFLIIYIPLLAIFLIKTFFDQFKAVKIMDLGI